MRDAGDGPARWRSPRTPSTQRRVAGTRFAAALFTNLTRDHLDYHPDVESYFAAKRGLFARPAGEGGDPPGASNLDDEFGRRLAAGDRRPRLRGQHAGRGAAESTCAASRPASPPASSTPRGPGRHRDPPARALQPLQPPRRRRRRRAAGAAPRRRRGRRRGGRQACPGASRPIDRGQPFPVIVDYAHTPDSLDNVLRAARELVDGGPPDRRLRLRRRPRPRQAAPDGRRGATARRRGGGDVGQPSQRGPGGDHRRDRGGRRGRRGSELVVEVDRRAAIGRALARGATRATSW